MAAFHTPRRATELSESGRDTRWLADWRSADAYVLLGDPGAGKTTSFKAECQAEGGIWATARDVLARVAPKVPQGGVVFIDGLDEVRAGEANGRVPFDQLRRWLNEQGRPRLRLCCREADWLGYADLRELAKVTPKGEVRALHLEPLQDEDILGILVARSSEVADAQAFLRTAEQTGLTPLLSNPLLLDLVIRGQSAWFAEPNVDRRWSRSDIYRAACEQLAVEHNPEHRNAGTPRAPGGVQRVLDAAGWLCAVLLLSGKAGVSEAGTEGEVEGVPLALLPPAPDMPDEVIRMALRSKLFCTQSELLVPTHRTIAEYLAARFLAKAISGGLPVGRVMALMQGKDGVPVEPLRGLWAWLAVQHLPARTRLMAIDPLGFVLNGDAMVLTHDERMQLLTALRDAFAKDPWLRTQIWNTPLFGPLATRDMADTLQALLQDHRDDLGHESLLTCLFEALGHGETLPTLAPTLSAWVEDGATSNHLRVLAYRAWKRCAGWEPAQALAWLQNIKAGTLPDDDDELCGALLPDLYPDHVPPTKVFDHWHPAKQSNFYGNYRHFWIQSLWDQTTDSHWLELVDGWLRRIPSTSNETPANQDSDAHRLAVRLLSNVLPRLGDAADSSTLHQWLGLGLDEYGTSTTGNEPEHQSIRQWLQARPCQMKAIVRFGLWNTNPDPQGHWPFWQAEDRLLGAKHPRDWPKEMLSWAEEAPNAELAEYCFFQAARAALEPPVGMEAPSMEDMERWVHHHQSQWPNASNWLESAWSMPLIAWQSDHWERRQKHLAAREAAQTERSKWLEPHWPSLLDGSAPARLLHKVAVAYDRGFSDVPGSTPLERVKNLLLCDEARANAVLSTLPRVLNRDDLPTVAEILALEKQGRQPLIRSPLLLAARLAHEREPSAHEQWPQTLVEKLVASYLTDGTGEMPAWYRLLVQLRPEWVAPVLVQYASPKLKMRGELPLSGVWALHGETDHARLAQMALPSLLQAVPNKASEPIRRTLNRALLPALAALPPSQASLLMRSRLERGGMDPGQTIAWLVAELPYRAQSAADLCDMVGHNERRAAMLGEALQTQVIMKQMLPTLPPEALQHLIAVLAPVTSPDRWGDGEGSLVTAAAERSDTVHALCSALSSNPSDEAARALAELKHAPGLKPWQTVLSYSQRTQTVVAREARFEVPSPTAVAQVLANLAPAHPPDLCALVVQHLQDLQAIWRGREEFVLRQFWRDTPEGGREPQVENDCRDWVLEKLRTRLNQQNIQVSSECRAAQDKRADLCVEYLQGGRRISLPVEVKKADHKALWTAWRDQLEHLYTIDPDTQGCGLYLVLWFGEKWRKMHPEGLPLHSAAGLQEALEAQIPLGDRHRLKVLVLDLSWPDKGKVS